MDKEKVFDEIRQTLAKLSDATNNIVKRAETPREFLTEEEVGNLLGVSSRTLRYYRQRRYIDYIKIGAQVYYPNDAITKMMERHKVIVSND